MKKGLYILLFIFGFIVVSCDKQEIVPFTDGNTDVPEWNPDYQRGGDSGEPNDLDEDSEGNDITDPNDDPDGKSGK